MKRPATILIADRNPYVRQFLQREMAKSGYDVLLAETGRQVLFWIDRQAGFDLVVLDPDLPDIDVETLMARLRSRIPCPPVVVHGHTDNDSDILDGGGAWFVEKGGNSVERIIQVVERILVPCHRTHDAPLRPRT